MTFYEFLISTGLNDTGAQEVIRRVDEDRADHEDLNLYNRWKEQQE